jgi:hypothetical protein
VAKRAANGQKIHKKAEMLKAETLKWEKSG